MSMIIDAHVHAGQYPQHFAEDFAAQMMKACNLATEHMNVDIPSLLAEMDNAGVDKAFLLAFDVERTLGFKIPNEYVADICQTYPDRFIGFGSVDGGVPGAEEQVKRFVTDFNLQGVKTAPAYVHLSPADPCWYGVYGVAQALNLPILVHTGFTPIKQAEQRFFPPMLLDKVATDFPDLRLVLAHLGTPWVSQCIDLLVKHPNLYADLSIVGWFQPVNIVAGVLANARSKGVLNRMLWGTDYPMCSHAAYLARMEQMTQDNTLFPDGQALTQEEWDMLKGGTALRLLVR